jgi:cellulose synthase/poly-beta-1,6-N-acetylglucosamine synthase-like glycosyltransferase
MIFKYNLIAKVLLSILLGGFLALSILGLYVGLTYKVIPALITGFFILLGVAYCYSDLFSFKLIIENDKIVKKSLLHNKEILISEITFYIIDKNRLEYVLKSSNSKLIRFTIFLSDKNVFKKWLIDNNLFER